MLFYKRNITLFFIFYSILFSYHSYAQETSTSPPRAKVLNALNNYIDVIDLCALHSSKYPRVYHRYNTKLIASKNNNRRMPSFYAMPYNFKLPIKAYNKALASSKYIPRIYQPKLKILFDSLWSIQKKQEKINIAFRTMTKEQPGDSLSFSKGFVWLDQLYYLNESYRKLSSDFYKLAQKIDFNYTFQPTSWNISGDKMSKSLTLTRSYLHEVKKYLKNQTPLPITDSLELFLNTMKINRDKNLSKLREIGSYNGKDPHSKYDYLIHKLITFTTTIVAYPPSHPNRYNLFDQLIFSFNNAVDYYNKFAALSFIDDQTDIPSFLLKTPRETQFFIPRLPQDPHTTPAIVNHITPETSMVGFAPNRLVFLLDVSGSMNHANKLPLFKKAIKEISTIMRNNDTFSVIIYSDNANVILENVSFTNVAAIEKLLQLKSKGKTNVYKGLQKAYTIAKKQYSAENNNRILMITDGDFEISKKLYKLISSTKNSTIKLSVFSFGDKKTHRQELKQMADLGHGNYIHIDATNNIKTILQEIQVIEKN